MEHDYRTQGIIPGDLLRVIYHGAQTSLVKVTKVKQYSIVGKDGEDEVRITYVGPDDQRLYARISPVRTTVLRPITFKHFPEGR